MSQLVDNLNAIYNEKTEKIKPRNIRKGVQIFDVFGSYEGGSSSTLPNEYQEVEYIRSNGTQYIDTGVCPETLGAYSVMLEFSFPYDISAGYEQWVFGQWFGSNGWRCGGTGSTGSIKYDTDRGFNYSANTYNTRVRSASPANTIVSPDYPMLIFAQQETGTPKYLKYSKYSLYMCRIWKDNELIRDYVPCYRKSDSIIGLFDLVSGEFYTNAGTGTFTKGEDVLEYT